MLKRAGVSWGDLMDAARQESLARSGFSLQQNCHGVVSREQFHPPQNGLE